MQVEAVQALQVQSDMTIQHVVDRDRHRAGEPLRPGKLRNLAYERRMRLPARKRHAEPETSAVSGGACLDLWCDCPAASARRFLA